MNMARNTCGMTSSTGLGNEGLRLWQFFNCIANSMVSVDCDHYVARRNRPESKNHVKEGRREKITC